jgi:Bacterial archaeo-eukaryotic release factor family 3
MILTSETSANDWPARFGLVRFVHLFSGEDIMTETKTDAGFTTALLSQNIIPELIRAEEPCITLLLPPYRPGEPSETAAVLMKVEVQQAAKDLSNRGIAEPLIATLLEPLHELSQERSSLTGSGLDRVIFRSQGIFRQLALPVKPSPARPCTVGACFWIRPILPSLALPEHPHVLEVTKESVRLLACGLTRVVPIELPKGIPKTLDEALGFKAPDHDLMNRSPSGPSTGAMRGVQFGTGSEREAQHAHLHDFYRLVDRGVIELLRSNHAPLILAGVEQDVAIYRSISNYPNLLEQGIHGSPGAEMTPERILRKVHDITLFDSQRRTALRMSESKERLEPGRFSTDLESILRAAEGRVSELYLDENGQRMGTFAGRVFGGKANWHYEDLLNVAAVETLRGGGAVYSLPSHLMAGAVAAAAFRY